MRNKLVLTAVEAAVVVVVVVVWQLVSHVGRSTPTAAPGSATAAPTGATWHSATPSGSAGLGTAPSHSAPTTSAPADCAAARLAGLDLDQRVGQLLMIGTPIADPSSLDATVQRFHLGGVFLAGRSSRTAAALASDITGLQSASASGVPLLVALDQEGGTVQTLKGPDFPIIPSAVKQGTWTTSNLRAQIAEQARRMAAIGVNQNLAPVADTVPDSVGTANPPIGAFHREFGSTPDTVSAAIRTVVPASQNAGVLTTLKHFPGLGRVRANTDTTTGAVDTTTTATDPYLEPFRAGIDAGTAAVMVSSARYPKLDSESVAAFSTPIITGLLRDRLGFRGLVMSDDLGAAVAVADVTTGQRAVLFVRAGGDLVLSVRSQDAAPMAAALVAAAKADPAFAARIADAAGHVLHAKQRAGLLHC